jgi:uncharacterized membrane protein
VSEQPHEPVRRIGAMARLRNYFLTGLVIAAPLALTIYITRTFVDWIDGWVTPYIPAAYMPDTYIHYSIPGFGVVVALVCITLLGFLVANIVGRRLVHFGESLLARMPIVRNIYSGLKQIFETALSAQSKPFTSVGLIEFPRKGLWSVVFVVGQAKGEVATRFPDADGEDIFNIFVPTTPTPLSGYLVFAKRSDVIILDMTIEEAAKLVISAGIVAPEFAAEIARSSAPISLDEASRQIEAEERLNRISRA